MYASDNLRAGVAAGGVLSGLVRHSGQNACPRSKRYQSRVATRKGDARHNSKEVQVNPFITNELPTCLLAAQDDRLLDDVVERPGSVVDYLVRHDIERLALFQ